MSRGFSGGKQNNKSCQMQEIAAEFVYAIKTRQ